LLPGLVDFGAKRFFHFLRHNSSSEKHEGGFGQFDRVQIGVDEIRHFSKEVEKFEHHLK
jgi:hypothetical protein